MALQMTVMNHRIWSVSENIGWVLFELGSSYLDEVEHKIIPYTVLPWQPFVFLAAGPFKAGLILSFVVVIRHVHSR